MSIIKASPKKCLILFYIVLMILTPCWAQRRRPSAKSPSTTVAESTTLVTTTLAPTSTIPAKRDPVPLGVRDSAPVLPQGSSWGAMFGAFLFVLCLAALCALGAAYFLRGKTWLWLKNGKSTQAHCPIRVLESIPLGQRRYLTVIDIGGEKHLLGLSPSAINYLTKLSPAASAEFQKKPPSDDIRHGEEATGIKRDISDQEDFGLSAPPGETPSVPKPGTFEEEYRKLKARLSGK